MSLPISRFETLPPLNVIGLMSGTSLDGVDITYSQISWKNKLEFHIENFNTYPFPPELRRRLFHIIQQQANSISLQEICEINFEVGEFLSNVIFQFSNDYSIPLQTIDLIGSHGHTFFHQPPAQKRITSTLQLGEPAVIAARTGITTIADFRPADMACGGQGAPLVPYIDQLLFQHSEQVTVAQNIGGIANLTYLPKAHSHHQCLAFDSGPGNMIIDHLTFLGTHGQKTYDKNGDLAAKGQVQPQILNQWLEHPFYSLSPPKSTGREVFGNHYSSNIHQEYSQLYSLEDLLATATALTARTIANSYRDFLPSQPDIVYISGGGVHNKTLMEKLQQELLNIPVLPIKQLPPDAKEAFAFGVLAYTSLFGIANNLSSVTGASKQLPLGKIIPGQNYIKLMKQVLDSHLVCERIL